MSEDNRTPEKSSSGDPAQERQYTLTISEKNREHSFSQEDERWTLRLQIRDWLVLTAAVIVWLAFQLMFFFLVPGLK